MIRQFEIKSLFTRVYWLAMFSVASGYVFIQSCVFNLKAKLEYRINTSNPYSMFKRTNLSLPGKLVQNICNKSHCGSF